MKKLFLAIGATLLAPIPLFSFGAPTPPSGELCDVYVGLGITNWSMTYSLSDSLAASTNTASNRRYDTAVSPYLMKAMDVRFKNLYGFELGLNLVANQLGSMFDFKSSSDYGTATSTAQQLALYLSRHVTEHISVKIETKFRKFAGTATLVNLPYGAPVLNAYDAQGNYAAQTVGSKVGWSSSMREIAVLAAYSPWKQPARMTDAIWLGYYGGYRNYSYTAPAEISIDNFPQDYSSLSVSSLVAFDALMISQFNANTLEFGLAALFQSRAGYGLSFNIPICLGGYGLSNPYLDMPSALIAVVPFQTSVFYAGENWQLVLGLDVTTMMAVSSNGTATLKKNLPYRDQYGSGTLAAGQSVNVYSLRSEIFWGPHLSFIYTF